MTTVGPDQLLSDALNAAGVANNPTYTGQVATRTLMADLLYTSATQGMFRRAYFMRDKLTSFQVVYGNFYCTTTGEGNPGAPRTITASIEYPAGTIAAQVTFAGQPSAVMADGLPQLVSDPIALSIPKGAQFWVNTFTQSSAGLLVASQTYHSSATLGDQASFPSNNSQGDATMTAGWSGTAGAYQYGPYAIIGTTGRSSVAQVGDSRLNGATMTAPVSYRGELEPVLAPSMAVLDLSRVSQQATQLANSNGFTKRQTYLQYVSHAALNLGINDINVGGRSAAQIAADRQTIRLFAPNLKWFETTLEPYSTSTDAWATLTNQAVTAGNAQRIVLNEQVRAGSVGFEGMIDMAAAVESSLNSGLWAAPPMVPTALTGDGIHALNAGVALYRRVVNTGIIKP